jgi:hypothetical protein
MNLALRCLSVTLAVVLPGAGAWATDYDVVTRPNLECSGLSRCCIASGSNITSPMRSPASYEFSSRADTRLRASVCLGGRLDKTGTHANDGPRGEAVGKPSGARVYTTQRLNLSKLWEGTRRTFQGLEPDPGNLAVRECVQ